MKHKLISLKEQSEWEAILSRVPHAYGHSHWYNKAMQIASGREVLLYAGEAEGFTVICPLSPRQQNTNDDFDITTPYGFSGFASGGSSVSFAEDWHSFMRSKGYVCGHIALHPFLQNNSLYASSALFSGKQAYYLDLKVSLESLYQNLSDDHRHRLRQWQKKQYSIVMDKTEPFMAAFISNYTASLQARNAAQVYDFGNTAWRLILTAPQASLFSVVVDNQIEASALFISYGDMADYYMIASTQAGRLHARGIIWEAIQYYANAGCRWLHLGCGVKENDALEQFKARFGGKPFTTQALKQVYDQDAYRALCAKYRTNSEDLNGYFPSYWAAKIPAEENIAI